ncbi:MAG: SIMPL domain-containing protein [Candidatus Bathyarchaeia archaeon]
MSIILAAAIIAYKPLAPQEGGEGFRFPAGIPPSLGAVASTWVDGEQANTISLSGSGSASARADQATLTVGVQTEMPYASEAVEENARLMTAVIDAIEALGISEDNITTVTYSVHPIYDYELKKTTGYRVVNMVQVRIGDLDMAGAVIDAAGGAGANRIDSVTFGLSEDRAEQLKLQAYREALKDAEEKAKVIEEGLGLKITGVYSVSESVYYPYTPYRGAETFALDAKAPTPIIEGTLSVSVTLRVVYTFQ